MGYTDTILDQARAKLAAGQPSEAWELAAPIAEAEPDNPRAWHLLADISGAAFPDRAAEYRQKAQAAEAKFRPLTTQQQPLPHSPQYQNVAYQPQPPPRQSAFTPFSPPPPAPRGAPAAAGTMLGGAAMIILGSLLPWATVSAGILQRSMNGIDGDGKITIVGGVLALLAGITLFTRPVAAARALGILGAIVAGGVAILDLINVSDTNTSGVNTSIGVGLYLIPLGALLVLVAAGMQRAPTPPRYPTYQPPRR